MCLKKMKRPTTDALRAQEACPETGDGAPARKTGREAARTGILHGASRASDSRKRLFPDKTAGAGQSPGATTLTCKNPFPFTSPMIL